MNLIKRLACLLLAVIIVIPLGACRSANTAALPTETPFPEISAAAKSTAAPTPTPEPTPSPTPEPERFTIAWMSDTQAYVGSWLDVLQSMFVWTAENVEKESIRALVHTGDMIQDMTKVQQWQNLIDCDALLPSDVLRVTVSGNHDSGFTGKEGESYLKYRIDTQLDPERETCGGLCHWATLEAGGMKLLILSIGYLHEKESLDWANAVLAAHPDHYGILLAHSYLGLGSDSSDNAYTSNGKILRDGLVKTSPNLQMVLCGHIHGSVLRILELDDDGDGTAERRVHQVMLNYQDSNLNAAGYMRLIRFDPMADAIEIFTYSPYLDQTAPKNDPLGASYLIESAGLSTYMVG